MNLQPLPGETRDEYAERCYAANVGAPSPEVDPAAAESAKSLLNSVYAKRFDRYYETEYVEPLPWWKRFLNPTFRKWAYGVSIAAVGVLAAVLERPEIIPLAAPLILALFYVDSNGDGK